MPIPPDFGLRQCKKCGEKKPLKEGFHIDRINHAYKYVCKACANRAWSQRGTQWAKAHPKEYRRKQNLVRAFEVVMDPTQVFPRGSIFESKEFRGSMRDALWPVGLIVRHRLTGRIYTIVPCYKKQRMLEGLWIDTRLVGQQKIRSLSLLLGTDQSWSDSLSTLSRSESRTPVPSLPGYADA
jgi:hypothetical protein